MKRVFVLFLLILLGLRSYGELRICTTTSLVHDLVKQVVGERAEVYYLMGPGVDPHLYNATAQDLKRLSRADIIFYNGLHLEGHMVDVFEKLAKQGRAVYAVAEGIPREELLLTQADEAVIDPHVWFDPSLWAYCLNTVYQEVAKKDPDNQAYYKAQMERYRSKLRDLLAWGRQRAGSIAPEKRILITSHDAYNYFGQAFGFQVVGVQGISTATEAGLADITSTIDFIKRNKVPAIFVETSVSPAAINKIASDSKATIGGELFSDSLGTPGERVTIDGKQYDLGTYEGVFMYNMNTIVSSLNE